MHAILSAILSIFTIFHPVDYTKSIVPLQMLDEDGKPATICTTFSINKKQHFYGTAAHCVIDSEIGLIDGKLAIIESPRPVLVCGKPAKTVMADTQLDVAVVQAECAAPALERGEDPGTDYDPDHQPKVTVYGYGWGAPSPTTFHGTISNVDALGFMIFDMRVMHGHSGSPILDEKHEVVSVMQIGDLGYSGGCLYSSLDKLDPYWE